MAGAKNLSTKAVGVTPEIKVDVRDAEKQALTITPKAKGPARRFRGGGVINPTIDEKNFVIEFRDGVFSTCDTVLADWCVEYGIPEITETPVTGNA